MTSDNKAPYIPLADRVKQRFPDMDPADGPLPPISFLTRLVYGLTLGVVLLDKKPVYISPSRYIFTMIPCGIFSITTLMFIPKMPTPLENVIMQGAFFYTTAIISLSYGLTRANQI